MATDQKTFHVLLWRFRVRNGAEAEFEVAYGPDGDWARLFARGEGYLGTELLRDATDPRRYLTIDRWTDAGAFARFREAFADEYAQLDARCDVLTEEEVPLGGWSAVGER